MAYTESTMLELGTKAPDFNLLNTVGGEMVSLSEISTDKVGTVVMFICNHCPYVIHVNPEIVRIAKEYQAKGVGFVGISPTDIRQKPADSPELMKELAEKEGFTFPYLYDESQEVARAYDAACTPDIYVFDEDLKLYYRGRMDGSRPGNDVPLTGEDLRNALDLMLAGKSAPEKQYPSGGCGIKWKEDI